MEENNELPWYNKLNLSEIGFGSGKLMIAKNGKLDKMFKITIPEELIEES